MPAVLTKAPLACTMCTTKADNKHAVYKLFAISLFKLIGELAEQIYIERDTT